MSCFARQSSNFWLLVRAVRSFVRASSSASPPGGDGHLPLSGALPDMKATSTTYVALQRTYRAKARADLEAVQAHLTNVLLEAGLDGQAIPQEEIESFVKHAGYLRCIRGRSVQESREKPSVDTISAFNSFCLSLVPDIQELTQPLHAFHSNGLHGPRQPYYDHYPSRILRFRSLLRKARPLSRREHVIHPFRDRAIQFFPSLRLWLHFSTFASTSRTRTSRSRTRIKTCEIGCRNEGCGRGGC